MLLKSGTLDSMRTLLPGSSGPGFLGYGLGLMSIPIDGSILYGHKGAMYSHSIVYYSIDDEISVSLIINHSDNESLDAAFYSLFTEVVSYLESSTTGIRDHAETDVESGLVLFPNPFNLQTTISFVLSEPGAVSMEIYSSSGNKVAERLESHLYMGEHEITWQPQNLTPGVYFVRLYTAGRTEVKKLLYLE